MGHKRERETHRHSDRPSDGRCRQTLGRDAQGGPDRLSLLLALPTGLPSPKQVIDFGSASIFSEVRYVKEPYIQSRFYRAPEILLGLPFCEKVDVWSLGCVMAELHLGWPLYPGNNEYDQVRYICETQGLPKPHLLHAARKAHHFFKRNPHPDAANPWQLKSSADYLAETKVGGQVGRGQSVWGLLHQEKIQGGVEAGGQLRGLSQQERSGQDQRWDGKFEGHPGCCCSKTDTGETAWRTGESGSHHEGDRVEQVLCQPRIRGLASVCSVRGLSEVPGWEGEAGSLGQPVCSLCGCSRHACAARVRVRRRGLGVRASLGSCHSKRGVEETEGGTESKGSFSDSALPGGCQTGVTRRFNRWETLGAGIGGGGSSSHRGPGLIPRRTASSEHSLY